MRALRYCFLVVICCIGCAPESDDEQKNDEQDKITSFTHVITTESEYYTTDNRNGSIMFMGRIQNPLE